MRAEGFQAAASHPENNMIHVKWASKKRGSPNAALAGKKRTSLHGGHGAEPLLKGEGFRAADHTDKK